MCAYNKIKFKYLFRKNRKLVLTLNLARGGKSFRRVNRRRRGVYKRIGEASVSYDRCAPTVYEQENFILNQTFLLRSLEV